MLYFVWTSYLEIKVLMVHLVFALDILMTTTFYTLPIRYSNLPILACAAVSYIIISRDSFPVSPYSPRTPPTSTCILNAFSNAMIGFSTITPFMKAHPRNLSNPPITGRQEADDLYQLQATALFHTVYNDDF